MDGDHGDRSTHPAATAAAVAARFGAEFGGVARLFFAPGRVNLLGNHVDYNGGTVLPAAVDRGVFVAARLTSSGWIRLRSLDRELAVDLLGASLPERSDPGHDWASYPLGVLREFRALTDVATGVSASAAASAAAGAAGVDMVFGGDLPMASGLSSSAAIEVATAIALDALHETRRTLVDLALVCHRAETRYIGLQCGVMDQFASALGRAEQVLILDCATNTFDYAPLPASAVEFLVLDTGVPRRLAESKYNERVQECVEAQRILSRVRERPWLAQFDTDDLAAAGEALVGVVRKRATHVITEVARVADAIHALRAGDLARLGRVMNASHRSSRDCYEVSCAELDVITAAARECDEVFGARLTGAGFGGCAIALIRPGAAVAVQAHVTERFEAVFRRPPKFDVLRLGSGPEENVTQLSWD